MTTPPTHGLFALAPTPDPLRAGMGKSRLAKMVFFIAFVFCLAAIAARATFPASQTLAHYARPDFGSNKEPAVYKLSGQSGAQI